MVETRPTHPARKPGLVCPTCLADRLQLIRNLSDPDYGFRWDMTPLTKPATKDEGVGG